MAIETLKIYDEMDIGTHVRAVGAHMQSELQRRFADHPLVGEVRGAGLIAAVELVADKAAHGNFDPKAKVGGRMTKLMEENGVIGRSVMNDTLCFSPPLIITQEEVNEMLDRVGKALGRADCAAAARADRGGSLTPCGWSAQAGHPRLFCACYTSPRIA